MSLLPAGIDPWGAGLLVVLSFFSSLLTAAVGIGGGVTLLAAMTYVIPVSALIPLHGVVQLGSNTGRAIVMMRSAAVRMLVPFAVGAVIGAVVGAALVTDLPEATILFAIGAFILVTTWVKLPPLGRGQAGSSARAGSWRRC